MDTPHDPSRSDALCPSCGASLLAEASSCVVCGRQTVLVPPPNTTAEPAANGAVTVPSETVQTPAPEAAVPRAEAPAQPEPVRAAAQTVQTTDLAATADAATAPTGSLRFCDWCGAANPVTAPRCEKCGASFPRPEQDDLLTRASAERVRLALDEIEMHERLRTPWWRRLFGGKTT